MLAAPTRSRPHGPSWPSSPRSSRSRATSPTPSTCAASSRPPARGSTCSSTTPACSARARSRRSPTTRWARSSTSTASTCWRRWRCSSSRCRGCAPGACVLNVTSDAAVEPYEGWGGYGSSKAALEQLTRILGAEHPDLRIVAVDPGDMRTQMHQEAFPGEDISDRPLPEASVPGLLAIVDGDCTERALPGERGDAGMSEALAFELPRGWRRPSRRRCATRCGCSPPRSAGIEHHAASPTSPISSSPATCWSSTRRRRSRRRSPAGGDAAAAPLDAPAGRVPDDGASAGSSSCATATAPYRRGRAGEKLPLPGGGEARAAGAVPGRAAAVGRPAHAPRAAARLPRPARRADPLLPPARAAAAVRLPDDLRARARQRRDAERRPAVQPLACSTRWPRAACGSPIVLHCGVSSLERGEMPYPERFQVSAATAEARQRRLLA